MGDEPEINSVTTASVAGTYTSLRRISPNRSDGPLPRTENVAQR
jgi:hypothetical protein